MPTQGLVTPEPLVQTGKTYAERPLIRRLSNEDIEKQKEAEAMTAFQSRQNRPVISNLASHIRSAFTAAVSAKSTIQQRGLMCLRQREGIYEADVQQLIKQSNGTNIYMMITDVKCRALEGWLKDIMLPSGEKPYSIDPTPIPDIPPQLVQKATQAFVQDYMGRVAQQAGVDPATLPAEAISEDDFRQAAEQFKDELLAQVREQAKKDADAIENNVDDELTEGKWYECLSEFIEDFATYPTAFMEGPIYRKRSVLAWEPIQGTMMSRITVAEKIVKEYDRVDFFDVYPAPGAKTVQDGDLCIRKRYTRRDLDALRGVEGFDSDAIDQILKQYARGYREWVAYDTEIADLHDRPNETQDPEGHIDGIKFFGSVQGFMLREWGMSVEEIPDPYREYPVIAYLVGTYVIGARLNPHPLGRRNIYKASFRNKNGSIWGKAPAEVMRDNQNICNSAARAMCNNAAVACLTGDTVVYRQGQRHGKAPVTLLELWNRKHSHNSGLRRTKLRSLDEETGKFFSNRVVDILDNGIAEVFEVVTERGYRIKATSNHRFMREDGEWSYLDSFGAGSLIAVNGQAAASPLVCIECGGEKSARGIRCRKCASQFHNSEWNRRQAEAARTNRDSSGTTARRRKVCRLEMKDFCADCGVKASESKGLHQHHKDRDPWRNEPDNLMTLCEPCHVKRHTKEDSFGDPFLHRYVSYDRVVSIRSVGMERVFDLVMTGPNHNFIANGFVSHNSGPQCWQFVDLIPAECDRTNIYPWKIWEFSSERVKAAGMKPMEFYQPDLHVGELLKLYQYYFEQASEVTGIPAYIYGSEKVGGAGSTASGLSMLMNAAAKGLRNAASNIDKGVIAPSVEEHWLTIMLTQPSLARGDCRIKARASEYLIQQEQLQMRRSEVLERTNNPVDLQIMGIDGRAELLRENFKSLKMNVDKLIPRREDMIVAQVQQQVQQIVMKLSQSLGVAPEQIMAALQSPGPSAQPGKPQEIGPDGQPMAGKDVRMVNQ
jgi:5-methylcytosine-specific restriction endonuclease McrA